MASALQPAIDAILAKVSAVTPTTDPTVLFVRKSRERLPAGTRAPRRLYDVDFQGHGQDRPAGLMSRTATIRIAIEYPVGNVERALETVLAEDSEALVRAITAQSIWAHTPVIRATATTTVDREAEKTGQGTGILKLLVSVEFVYRDTTV